MTDGVGQRAEIDLETFRALLWLNGGGALAVLTFLSTVINTEGGKYLPLAFPILVGVIVFAAGLVLAVLHNMARRECARRWQVAGYQQPGDPPIWLCAIWLRLTSLACFAAAITYMAIQTLWFLKTLPTG